MEVKKFFYFEFMRDYVFNRVKLCDLLIEYGIFAAEIDCPKCEKAKINRKIKLNTEHLWYQCSGTIRMPKKAPKKCNYRKAARLGTFFQGCLSLERIFE